MPRRLLLSLLLAFAACLPLAAQDAPYGRATLSPLPAAPGIDGRRGDGEWAGAAGTTGFQNLGGGSDAGGWIEPRSGQTLVSYHGARLYILVVSDYAPDGKDHSSSTNRDKDYVGDESVEIWLDPNRGSRESQQGDLRFYQMIANAAGGIYDVSFDPRTGPDTGWNGDWQMASTLDHEAQRWTCELSLPLADLGWDPAALTGKALGVMVSRNFKQPWSQATWFPVLGAFVDWYRYAELTFTADAPTVQIQSLGGLDLHRGLLDLQARIHNPGPARQVKLSFTMTSSDMPGLTDEKVLDLPAQGHVDYRQTLPDGRLHAEAQHALRLLVTAPDGSATYMDYRGQWKQAPEKLWTYRIGPDPDAAVRHAYYPSLHLVRLRLDAREIGQAANSGSGRVTITGPDGGVLDQALSYEAKGPYIAAFAVGDLKPGAYRISVAMDGWGDPISRSFEHRDFAWEGNTLGITDAVLAPFTPLTVDGDTVGVIYRDYTLSSLGLPSSIRAAGNVSAGGPEELLTGPVTLSANGTPLAGSGGFTAHTALDATWRGAAVSPAVTVSSEVLTEIDGCLKVTLDLKPGSDPAAELQSLVLDIPLRDALMPLWHVSTTGLRINPAGFTPAGDGEIWDSRNFPDGNWFGNFKCYLWLGAEERGLAWFADNDAGWVLHTDAKGQPDAPAQQLIRHQDVLTLRVNLVQAPIRLTEPRRIVFGLMASPAKPMRADWRRTDVSLTSSFNMGYASPATFCAKMPWGDDWAIADWAYARRTGKPGPTPEAIEAWKARNFPADMDPAFRESVINLALGPFLGNFRPSQTYFTMYFEEFHTNAQVHPESHIYQSEWSGNWLSPLLDHPTLPGHKMWGISVRGITPSYRDFAVWYAAQWARRGIGSYFDNAFPTRAEDPLTTTAYRLPNGQIQPTAGIWARRDYLRRIWTVHRTEAPPDANPAMMIHMTNTHILPYMVWNDENLDLEWKFGPEIQQTKFPHAMLRAETLGRQTGNVPWALDRIEATRTPEEKLQAELTRFGCMMVHEIRWWGATGADRSWFRLLDAIGYGGPDCRVYNYWDRDAGVSSTDPEAKTLLLVQGDRALLLLASWNPKPATVTFTFDGAAIGFTPTAAAAYPYAVVKVKEAAVPSALPAPVAGALTLQLDPYAVRLIELK